MSMYLRKATMDDAGIILDWRNDPQTRAASFSGDEISYESHVKWLRGKLASKDCAIFILVDGQERIGQIRVDKIDRIGEISYMIAPEKRNRGYGRKILGLAEQMAGDDIKVLAGLVMNHNEASMRCFRANNYSELIGGGGVTFLKIL